MEYDMRLSSHVPDGISVCRCVCVCVNNLWNAHFNGQVRKMSSITYKTHYVKFKLGMYDLNMPLMVLLHQQQDTFYWCLLEATQALHVVRSIISFSRGKEHLILLHKKRIYFKTTQHGKEVEILLSFIMQRLSLRWRHNGRDSVSNHLLHDCLFKRLFRRRSKKTSKLRVTGLCAAKSPGTGEFPAQMASNSENVSIWWRHHVMAAFRGITGDLAQP